MSENILPWSGKRNEEYFRINSSMLAAQSQMPKANG